MEYTAMSEAQYADLDETAGQSPAESRARIDMTFIYNTSNYGRGNQGHTWGDSLNSKERSAVIEFLKSLSGADMPPVELQQQVSVEQVNEALKSAADGRLKGILGFETRPLVSVDYTNDRRSGIVDGLSTMVINNTQVKLLIWYDNEIGYVNRMMELAGKIARSI